MKKIIVFVLLLSVAFSVKSIGLYGDYFAVVSDNYVAKIPQDLSQEAGIQNNYVVSLAPRISINDAAIDFALPVPTAFFDNPQEKYVIEKRDTVFEIEIYGKVVIEGNQIVSDIYLKNTGPSSVKLGLVYNLKGQNDKTFLLFSPENYNNKTSNYLVLLQPSYNGQAVAVISSQEIRPTFMDMLETKEHPLYFSIAVFESGQTFSMQIKYYPFVLKQEGILDYPIALYSFMNEPLINTRGSAPDLTFTGSLDEKINSMMDAVRALTKKGDEFSAVHDVDFGTSEFDSLDSSVYFKQLCINSDVPCRLVIGKSGDALYSWIKAYNGKWIDVDVQKGIKQTPASEVFYLEPQAGLHTMPFSDDAKKMIFEGTSWISTIGQLGFLIYFIIIIALASVLVFLFQFKKVVLEKLMAKKGTIGKTEIDVSGKYEVLSEEIDDPFLKEIIKKIKEKDGMVNIEQLVETMHFSRELVEDGITYLIDQKFLKKIM